LPLEQTAPDTPHTAPPSSVLPFVFMNGGALQASAKTFVTPYSALIFLASHSCPWSSLTDESGT